MRSRGATQPGKEKPASYLLLLSFVLIKLHLEFYFRLVFSRDHGHNESLCHESAERIRRGLAPTP